MRYEDVPAVSVWNRDSALFGSAPSANRVAALRNAFQAPNAQPAKFAPPPLPGNRAGLETIDKLIRTYHQPFPGMQKTDILQNLHDAIDAWHSGHPGALPMAMGALKEAVDTKLKYTRVSASRYNKAICIAYHTGCNYDATTGKTYKNHWNWKLNDSYFRHSSDDATDMQQKCEDLWAGIQAAQTGIAAHNLPNDNQTLKIFMAPEFYFRGKKGAYSTDIVSEIIPRMMRLGTAGPLYSDWLFVFGTAVASFEVSETLCSKCSSKAAAPANIIRFERDPLNPAKTIPVCSIDRTHPIMTRTYGAEVQNVALIQHGNDSHMVAKEYVSNIDYTGNKFDRNLVYNTTSTVVNGSKVERTVRREVIAPLGSHDNPGLPGNRPSKPGKPGVMKVRNDERMGGCVFTMDGLTIGLEVCLDHATSGVNPNAGRAAALAPTIHILLIPSFGMDIDTGLYCKTNGIAFNVDGRGRGISEVKLNTPPHTPQSATVVNNRISLYGPFNIPA